MASVSDLFCVTFTNRIRTLSPDDEIQQSTALRWLAEFLTFAHEVMIPFTPRLVPAILPNLAHHVSMIQSAAIRTNKLLLSVIQKLPSPQEPSQMKTVTTDKTLGKVPRSPTPTTSATNSRQSTLNSSKDGLVPDSASDSQTPNPQRSRMNTINVDPSMTPRAVPAAEILPTSSSSSSRPHSPLSFNNPPASNLNGNLVNGQPVNEEIDPFDYQATVNELTIQFLSEFEETRVAALKWLIMLHQKAPRKVGFISLAFKTKTY